MEEEKLGKEQKFMQGIVDKIMKNGCSAIMYHPNVGTVFTSQGLGDKLALLNACKIEELVIRKENEKKADMYIAENSRTCSNESNYIG